MAERLRRVRWSFEPSVHIAYDSHDRRGLLVERFAGGGCENEPTTLPFERDSVKITDIVILHDFAQFILTGKKRQDARAL